MSEIVKIHYLRGEYVYSDKTIIPKELQYEDDVKDYFKKKILKKYPSAEDQIENMGINELTEVYLTKVNRWHGFINNFDLGDLICFIGMMLFPLLISFLLGYYFGGGFR